MSKKIKTASSVELDQISLNKVYKTSNKITKSTVTYQNQPFIIQGPQMVLGDDVMRCGDYIYVDLVFDSKSRKNNEFASLVKNIDYSVISEIYDHSDAWYSSFNPDEPASQPCLCQIESEFVPTVKLSILHQDQQCLKLKVKADQVEFYDQDQLSVPHLLLKKGYTSIPLLEMSFVYKDEEHFPLNFYTTQKAIAIYTTVEKQKKEELPDTESQIEDIKKTLKHIAGTCLRQKTTLTDYCKAKEGYTYKVFNDYNNKLINVYVLIKLPFFENQLNSLNPQDKLLYLKDAANNIQKYKMRLNSSIRAKKLIDEGLKLITNTTNTIDKTKN